ncbi:MAG TPA: hypothetical protein VH560_16905 [Polyangia bacterium]|nr:hypothetical protein [Polyangia bacterium]
MRASSRARAALLLLLLLAKPARAEAPHPTLTCGSSGTPVVRLVEVDVPVDVVFRAQLATQLEAGLRSRHLELCVAGAEAADDASEVELAGSKDSIMSIVIRDAITAKRVAREVDLRAVPPDARPLTVALAVDELLRASWLELTLPDAPSPSRPVPAAITKAIATPATTRASDDRWQLGAALAADHFGGGVDQAGVDVEGRVAVAPSLAFEAKFGLRAQAPTHAVDGAVHGTSIDASAGAALSLPPHGRRWHLEVLGDGRLMHVSLSGEPRPGARGADTSVTALYLSAGLRGAVRVAPAFGLSLTGAFGVPVHPVEIFDGGAQVASLSGPLFSLALGGWWRFR